MKDNVTIGVEVFHNEYDTKGAMIYIVIVLFWYSIGIILTLVMQVSSRSEEREDFEQRRTKLLTQNLHDDYNTKKILEELANKQNRHRLWDMYLGTNTKDRFIHAEDLRVRHIEKQLATINRNHRITYDTLFPWTNNNVNRAHSYSEYQPDINKTRTSLRRRSSLDQQTLDRWKQLTHQSKVYEPLPWAIRKIMLKKHFRRNTKKS
ncbi:unnamed protein product [Adineta steineri]|uniref:Uncharacterized protein n=1 Tax=Adineta steineri TaxID=433720 RepID=A0A813XUU5_9BILA|nr:unnamed protein product [Adineta steineri]